RERGGDVVPRHHRDVPPRRCAEAGEPVRIRARRRLDPGAKTMSPAVETRLRVRAWSTTATSRRSWSCPRKPNLPGSRQGSPAGDCARCRCGGGCSSRGTGRRSRLPSGRRSQEQSPPCGLACPPTSPMSWSRRPSRPCGRSPSCADCRRERSSMILPSEFESAGPVPERLLGYVSVASQGGLSSFEAEEATDVEPFFGTTDDHDEAARALEASGLEIIAESRLGKSVVGPPSAYEELTGGTLVTCERLLHAEAGRERYVTHVDIVGKGQPEALGLGAPASKTAKVEGVLLERPRILHGIFPAPIPPTVQKFHLRVPDDVAVAVGAVSAHRQGYAGQGVTVAMVDSGQFAHPFFVAHGYDVKPPVAVVPGASPTKDPVGHGTGESANIFAIAPGATLRPYRASNEQGQLVAAIAGFVRAKSDKPNVLTNSWGGDGPFPPEGPPDPSERAWALEIQDAVEQG